MNSTQAFFMNFADFKTYVAAYINRDASSFVRTSTVSGTIDLLGNAVNEAINDAQLQYDFNRLADVGYISTSCFGTALTAITTTAAGGTALPTKKVLGLWQYDDSNTSGNQKIRQINMILYSDLKNILPTLLDHMREPRTLPVTLKNRAYVYGSKLYVTGFSNPTVFWVDLIKSLPELSATTDTNFFITEYRKWTLFATLQQLNAYLPDNERVQVSTALLDRAWDIIIKDDADRVGANDTVNSLD